MKILWVSLVIIILGLANAADPPGGGSPTARSIANGFASAQASSIMDKDPMAVTWTTSWVYDNSKIDPVAISETAGYALAALEDTAFANSFSNAFAYSQGPNEAVANTWTRDCSIADDYSAYASSDSHAEGWAS